MVRPYNLTREKETRMKAGTIIELPDGRIGTVVYNSIDGVGIKWGNHNITIDDIQGNGNLVGDNSPTDDYNLFPDAMLRNPYPSADIECVGKEFKIIKRPDNG